MTHKADFKNVITDLVAKKVRAERGQSHSPYFIRSGEIGHFSSVNERMSLLSGLVKSRFWSVHEATRKDGKKCIFFFNKRMSLINIGGLYLFCYFLGRETNESVSRCIFHWLASLHYFCVLPSTTIKNMPSLRKHDELTFEEHKRNIAATVTNDLSKQQRDIFHILTRRRRVFLPSHAEVLPVWQQTCLITAMLRWQIKRTLPCTSRFPVRGCTHVCIEGWSGGVMESSPVLWVPH